MIRYMLYKMENEVQAYAWGSRSALAELYGFENPEGEPQAELWMGGHPKAPSRLLIGQGGEDFLAVPLTDHIGNDPEGVLGRAAEQFGPRLPFLFKVLCAGEPLSIQVHPSKQQAEAGFAREERDGPAIDAPNRNYRDDNHKPELICALTPFWGLRGFRAAEEIRAELTGHEFTSSDISLQLPESDDDIATFFATLLTLSEDERRNLVAAAIARATSRWQGNAGDGLPEANHPLARYYWVLRIAEVHPGDIGIISPLILHVFSLLPGEAIFQPAGILHAYLHGVGAELMANSDNVLRGGMTVKHIDVAELMKVGRFRPDRPEPVVAQPSQKIAGRGVNAEAFPTPFAEFELHRVEIDSGEATITGGVPQIILCHQGSGEALAGSTKTRLRPGESAFAEASTDEVRLTGSGVFFVARTP